MHLVAALDCVPSIRPVLVLAEGVASGAADGWARMTGRPASTLLHLGPGLAERVVEPAQRASRRVADRQHRRRSSRVASRARPAPRNRHRGAGAPGIELGSNGGRGARHGARWAEAVRAAIGPPGGIATLIVPADASWCETEYAALPATPRVTGLIEDDRIERAARALAHGARSAILIGGSAMTDAGMRAASQIASAVGARLFCTTFTARQGGRSGTGAAAASTLLSRTGGAGVGRRGSSGARRGASPPSRSSPIRECQAG